MNIYEELLKAKPNTFETILDRDNVTIGVSKIQGKWPYSEFSLHELDEIIIILDGKVEVEYSDNKKVIKNKGEIEVMKANLGHKVHNAQTNPSKVLLIFAKD